MKDSDAEQLYSKLRECILNHRINDAKLLMKSLSREERATVTNTKHKGYGLLLSLAVIRTHDAFVNFLLEECDADIEQRTDVTGNDATPLWYAVSFVKLDIVKILLSHGADVNVVCNGTTPLIKACSHENIDLVRCLVENGADIHRTDDNGRTCLMMASMQGNSMEVALYLLEQGASINAVDKRGKTALHHAIKTGYMDTVRLLAEYGADSSLCTEDGDDALRYAALHRNEEIVEYLVGESKATVQRRADTYSLLGATFVDNNLCLNAVQGLPFWIKAVNIRMKELTADEDRDVPNPVYNNAVEARDTESLAAIAGNVDAMRMQALVVRERILGLAHPETIKGICRCAAYYRDLGADRRCSDMAIYTLKKNYDLAVRYGLFDTLVLCFWDIFKADSTNIQLANISEVLEMTVANIKKVVSHSAAAAVDRMMLLSFIRLVHLACRLMSTDNETSSVHELVKAAVQTKCHTKDRATLLHLAVDCVYLDRPSRVVVESLLVAGADVNTPLHVAVVKWNRYQSQRDAWLEVINLLLAYGAHVDFVNAKGRRASDMLPSSVNVFNHVSLQCLAARTIRTHHLPYHGILPTRLADFVDKH